MKKINIIFDVASKYLDNGKYKKALKLFLKIEKKYAENVAFDIAYTYAKLAYVSGKEYKQKEIKWYKVAIKNGSCDANTNLAICYQDIKKLKKAKKYFKKAIKCGDNDASLDLALIYLTEFKIEKAKKYLNIVLAGIPYETVTEYSRTYAKKLLKRIVSIEKKKTENKE